MWLVRLHRRGRTGCKLGATGMVAPLHIVGVHLFMPTGAPQFQLPAQLLSGTASPRTISSLWEESGVEATSGDERMLLSLVLPPWQRPSVWDVERQRAFIEGILLGFPWCDRDGRARLDDGRWWQRSGEARLELDHRRAAARNGDTGLHRGRLTVFDGLRYGDLPRREQLRRFDRIVLTRIVLPSSTDEETLKSLYRRMNYGGVTHTQADLDRLGEQMHREPSAVHGRQLKQGEREGGGAWVGDTGVVEAGGESPMKSRWARTNCTRGAMRWPSPFC